MYDCSMNYVYVQIITAYRAVFMHYVILAYNLPSKQEKTLQTTLLPPEVPQIMF